MPPTALAINNMNIIVVVVVSTGCTTDASHRTRHCGLALRGRESGGDDGAQEKVRMLPRSMMNAA
jgi:hypothetical protein